MSINTPFDNQLFRAFIESGKTQAFEVPVRNNTLGVHLVWDAKAAATIVLQFSSSANSDLGEPTTASSWVDSGLTITAPTGAGKGASMINVDSVRQKRARIVITTSAKSWFEIYDGTTP